MMRKVRVVKYGQQPVMSKPGYSRGFNSGQFPVYYPGTEWAKAGIEVSKGLKPVPWEEANVEAEGGETAYVPDQGGLPAHFNINGPRHSEGGIPLNLPPDTFIYSDTRKMRLKGPLLEYFGKDPNKAYTPAEIAKQYDINKYRKILQNPDSDNIQRHSAELMIQNYNKKLGALALVQEAKKGFPDGVPVAAIPFLMTYSIEPESVLPTMPEQQGMPMMGNPMMQLPMAGDGIAGVPTSVPSYQEVTDWNKFLGSFANYRKEKNITDEQLDKQGIGEQYFNQYQKENPQFGYKYKDYIPKMQSYFSAVERNPYASQAFGVKKFQESGKTPSKTDAWIGSKTAYQYVPPRTSYQEGFLNNQSTGSNTERFLPNPNATSEKDAWLKVTASTPMAQAKPPGVKKGGATGTWAAPNYYQVGGTYSAQTEPEYGGNWMGKARSTKQAGGEEEILQVIQMYAQVTGQDPDQIVSQLKQMPADKAQQALQQMAQNLQQMQSQGSEENSMSSMYAYGGAYVPTAQAGLSVNLPESLPPFDAQKALKDIEAALLLEKDKEKKEYIQGVIDDMLDNIKSTQEMIIAKRNKFSSPSATDQVGMPLDLEGRKELLQSIAKDEMLLRQQIAKAKAYAFPEAWSPAGFLRSTFGYDYEFNPNYTAPKPKVAPKPAPAPAPAPAQQAQPSSDWLTGEQRDSVLKARGIKRKGGFLPKAQVGDARVVRGVNDETNYMLPVDPTTGLPVTNLPEVTVQGEGTPMVTRTGNPYNYADAFAKAYREGKIATGRTEDMGAADPAALLATAAFKVPQAAGWLFNLMRKDPEFKKWADDLEPLPSPKEQYAHIKPRVAARPKGAPKPTAGKPSASKPSAGKPAKRQLTQKEIDAARAYLDYSNVGKFIPERVGDASIVSAATNSPNAEGALPKSFTDMYYDYKNPSRTEVPYTAPVDSTPNYAPFVAPVDSPSVAPVDSLPAIPDTIPNPMSGKVVFGQDTFDVVAPTDSALKAWGFKYGGNIRKFQPGGTANPDDNFQVRANGEVYYLDPNTKKLLGPLDDEDIARINKKNAASSKTTSAPTTGSGKPATGTTTASTTSGSGKKGRATKTYDPSKIPDDIQMVLDEAGVVVDESVFEVGEIGPQSIDPATGQYRDIKSKKTVTYDTWRSNNQWYLDDRKARGLADFDPNNKKDVADFEESYNKKIYDDVYNELKKRGIDDDQAKKTADYFVQNIGFIDDPNAINYKDQKQGNFHNTRTIIKFKDKEKPPVKQPPKDKPLETTPAQYVVQPGYAPWWAQDLVNIYGAAGDFLRQKKYGPWAPQTEPVVYDPTFYDPLRALTANAEQAAIASQAASAFGAPQQLSARVSGIQAEAAKNVANTLGEYDNRNVAVANTFAGQKAGIYNQANEFDARRAQDLYDKTTIANQQFDNSRTQARQNLRQAYIAGITNRAQAQAMNTMYPNYFVDPSTGGYVFHRPGVNEMDDTEAASVKSTYDQLVKDFPGVDPDKLFEEAVKKQGKSSDKKNKTKPTTKGNPYGYPGAGGGYGYPGAGGGYGYYPVG